MALSGTIETLLFTSSRQFAGIIPDVTIEEQHTDSLTITDQPVEMGAAISDHAYKNPAEVTVKVGWSQQMALLNSTFSGGLFSGVTSLQQMYNQLLQLQASRVPFDLSTGKRQYQNMLIKQLNVTTDVETENVLMVTIVFREIIIVSTQTTTLAASDQAQPQQTAPIQEAGTKVPQPQKQSILSSLTGG
ncbi:phage baseplate protein [Chromobacterium subtsugae]|uniref:phage baseplate protein n=1 Tax=Chromobacterium subtsugae TaxID=251747 RepID=UPI0006413410|nr:hypothetical protein [Chromobacterium subtsugae]